MTPSNIMQEDLSHSRSVGPGDRLQAARNEMGLSIEDVATRMHLSIAILESIEENNFDDITAPIFVKGYLRAYARIVSLDEDEMIQQYQNYYSEEDPPISSTSNLAPEISSDDARIKWTTYLVIIGLLGLLAAWWWNQYQIKTDVVSLDADQASTMEQSDVVGDTTTDGGETTIGTTVDATEEIDVLPTPVEEQETLTAVIEAQVSVSPVAEELEVEAVAEQVEAEEQQVVEVAVDEAAVDEAAVEEIPGAAPVGTDQLKIIVHADTWVDVKDAGGDQLVRDLVRADQTLNLIGKAPFAVFLGNGHGVELIYDDQTIDISDRIRDNNTAKLKVGNS